MKVEHLTLGGNSMIRDTADILDTTRRHFGAIDINYESNVYIIPKLPFRVKVTAAKEGAIFDMQNRNGDIFSMNVCCFSKENKDLLFVHVSGLADGIGAFITQYKNPKKPKMAQWLYSAVINPMAVSPGDARIAGEVELYIYERLYQAWKRESI